MSDKDSEETGGRQVARVSRAAMDLRRLIEERALSDAIVHRALRRHRNGSLSWTEAMEVAVLALSRETERLRHQLFERSMEGSEP